MLGDILEWVRRDGMLVLQTVNPHLTEKAEGMGTDAARWLDVVVGT